MIEAKNLGVRFGEKWIFRNLNFKINPSESVVLIGPSGCGKSSLLRALAGILIPSEGSCKVDSARSSLLFQSGALFDSLTVLENLTFPMQEVLGVREIEAKKRAEELLSDVEIGGNGHLNPNELSGGMQKRLAIARALSVNPEVILYDDPTAGLDPVTSRVIGDLILKYRQEKETTTFSVTNDMGRASQLGDRVFLLANGKLIDGGDPKKAFSHEGDAFDQFVRGKLEGPISNEY